jgi:hypothetical protein
VVCEVSEVRCGERFAYGTQLSNFGSALEMADRARRLETAATFGIVVSPAHVNSGVA